DDHTRRQATQTKKSPLKAGCVHCLSSLRLTLNVCHVCSLSSADHVCNMSIRIDRSQLGVGMINLKNTKDLVCKGLTNFIHAIEIEHDVLKKLYASKNS